MISLLILAFLKSIKVTASVPNCPPFLEIVRPSDLTDLKEMITAVGRIYSPSISASVLAERPNYEALQLFQLKTLNATNWRRLTELAFARLFRGRSYDPQMLNQVLDAYFDSAPTIAIPSQQRRRKIFSRTFAPMEIKSSPEYLMRQLFRVRPEIDLRFASKTLRLVPDQSRFIDTFTQTMRTLFDDIANHPPASFGDLDQWTALIEGVLRYEFKDADLETRAFVSSALDRRFLGVPATPSPSEILKTVKVARSSSMSLIPGRGLEDRKLPSRPIRIRNEESEVDRSISTAAVPNLTREVSVNAGAKYEIENLPRHVRRKLDEFIEGAQNLRRYREMEANRGRWNIESCLSQFGPNAHSARLNAQYRVLYSIIDGKIEILRVNKGQIHGN